jgi:hypothetical protein
MQGRIEIWNQGEKWRTTLRQRKLHGVCGGGTYQSNWMRAFPSRREDNIS